VDRELAKRNMSGGLIVGGLAAAVFAISCVAAMLDLAS
jgi:hypothetical protein